MPRARRPLLIVLWTWVVRAEGAVAWTLRVSVDEASVLEVHGVLKELVLISVAVLIKVRWHALQALVQVAIRLAVLMDTMRVVEVDTVDVADLHHIQEAHLGLMAQVLAVVRENLRVGDRDCAL